MSKIKVGKFIYLIQKGFVRILKVFFRGQLLMPSFFLLITSIVLPFQTCREKLDKKENLGQIPEITRIQTGAEQIDAYLPGIMGKKTGFVVNHTSRIGEVHLVDTLISLGVSIPKIFAPEHGFRGEADAGEKIEDQKDPKTGIPLISLYGSNKKPTKAQLNGLDVVVFDIQDVGARFYTYISTMHYVMEACAENDIPVIILDRPNPNGHYVAGPVLDPAFRSFVGMHPIPVVHGMTVGELAQMINGEGWLKNEIQCSLKVIPCKNYSRDSQYELPIPPSPNLRTMRSVYLYPSLCFFEGTIVSVGRGTSRPFEQIGHPDYPEKSFYFIPKAGFGAKSPKLEGKNCYGFSFSEYTEEELRKMGLDWLWLVSFHSLLGKQDNFFLSNNFIDKLAGTDQLRRMMLAGESVESMKDQFQPKIEAFKENRKKYLIYPDI